MEVGGRGGGGEGCRILCKCEYMYVYVYVEVVGEWSESMCDRSVPEGMLEFLHNVFGVSLCKHMTFIVYKCVSTGA